MDDFGLSPRNNFKKEVLLHERLLPVLMNSRKSASWEAKEGDLWGYFLGSLWGSSFVLLLVPLTTILLAIQKTDSPNKVTQSTRGSRG
jgi:hypothetical protein